MKTRVFSMLVLLLALSTLVWADDDFKLTAGPMVPAAQGKVSIDHDRNGNDVVKMSVKHMAQPSALTPAKVNYVVWIQARGKDPENHGILRINENDAAASFSTTTPYKTFDVFVTAEDTPNPTSPGGPEVLRGTVQQ